MIDRGVSQYIYRYIINILFVGGRLTPRSVKKLLRLGEWVSYALIAITVTIITVTIIIIIIIITTNTSTIIITIIFIIIII